MSPKRRGILEDLRPWGRAILRAGGVCTIVSVATRTEVRPVPCMIVRNLIDDGLLVPAGGEEELYVITEAARTLLDSSVV